MEKKYKSLWISDENQKGDFSNNKMDTFDPDKGYIGIRLQQGVPLLDRDWNELEDIRRYQDITFRKYYIGDGISLKDAFKIKALSPESNDFQIMQGRYLLDGFDVYNPIDINFSNLADRAPTTLTAPSSGTRRIDKVYLEMWIKEINHDTTGVDTDPDLHNDNDVKQCTCVRHKIAWTVKVAEGLDMPLSTQFVHRSLLAVINRDGPVISQVQIADNRSMLRTFIPGQNGSLTVNANVGIGTTTPSAKLHVAGDLKVDSGATILGNVGIGTTTPNAKLHVAGDLKVDGALESQGGIIFRDRNVINSGKWEWYSNDGCAYLAYNGAIKLKITQGGWMSPGSSNNGLGDIYCCDVMTHSGHQL